jgi:hypothetical protein
MNIFFMIKVRIEVLINWSSGSSSVTLTIEPSMVVIFRACNAIDVRNMYLWCTFLEPHRATYHLNIYRCLIKRSDRVRQVYLRVKPRHLVKRTN